MNIGIDGNEANLTVRVGVGQYAYNLLLELSRQKTDHHYYIYLKNPPLVDMPIANYNWHYIVFGPQKLWTKFALPLHLYLSKLKLDLFYSPSHYSPHFSPFPTVPTIHDLGYLETPDQFTKKDFYQLTKWTEHSIKQATKIIAVSKFTKDEIVRIYKIDPAKIDIVYNGVSRPIKISKSTQNQVLKKFNITSPYFLYLGTLKPNKNIPFLIQAFSQFASKFQLVIAGKKGWLFDDIFSTVKKGKVEESVVFTDYISETEKWSLYQNATATVLPSLYEGFGIPAIEAQQSGSPVIASTIPPYLEILQNQSALLIDPTNLSDLTSALTDVQLSKVRSNLIKSGQKNAATYSWTNSAQSLLKVFNKL